MQTIEQLEQSLLVAPLAHPLGAAFSTLQPLLATFENQKPVRTTSAHLRDYTSMPDVAAFFTVCQTTSMPTHAFSTSPIDISH